MIFLLWCFLLPLSAAAVTLNTSQCLQHRQLQDLAGHDMQLSNLRSWRMVLPDSCQQVVCTEDPVVLHSDVENNVFISIAVDEHSPAGGQCMKEVQASNDSYRKSNFPVTMFSAGEVQLVLHDSGCPAVRLQKRRLLLMALLKASSVQPLEAFILCDWELQVTEPVTQAQRHAPRHAEVTHVTLYSGTQARTAIAGFVPQYARFELSNDFVVSVMSSCVGGRSKMEFINRLGATWLGEMDSCLRLLCHSSMEYLALGYYNYVLYDQQKLEGEACFRALEANNIGSTVNTPLTQVRIVSINDNSCTGTKVMVLNPNYAGTSIKLQRFLYYQAYKMHSFKCPELAESCLKQKLGELGYTSGVSPSVSEFPYHCANLLCDSRVGLQPSPLHDNIFRVTVENEKMKPLNNVCFKSLSRSKMSRNVEEPSVQVGVPGLGIYLLFGLL